MLCLSRRVGERIMIGDNITLVVVSIDRGRVKLGVDAPREIEIHRLELKQPKPNRPTKEP